MQSKSLFCYIFWTSLQDFKEKEFLWTDCKQTCIYLYLFINLFINRGSSRHKASQSVMK